MALSRLQIWNMAVGELPDARIDTIEEVSIAAEACRDQYQPSLELLLDDHAYDFANVRTTLAVVTNDREQEWDYAYSLPANVARPSHVLPFSAADVSTSRTFSWYGAMRGFEAIVPFRIEGGRLYTNQEGAILDHTTTEPSEATFTPKFARALALELACRIVMPVKKDRARQLELIRMAEIARERAKADDMNRDRESPRDFVPEVQLARLGLI
ncbi:hypothetical protein Q9Q95_13330 [Sphingomonas sp. DG1-23]|uniref:hypothetical protein n=1 Tax=Sphingomonas sp. DG1-23 TaxID=3068316 RepID=UPI00273D4381|nr:hypothetical protein [Sphingomonas sp. DG1-23]MDP5279911.1 hypothetical protein [Sphingomonas sp. DG1-23]